MQRISRDLVSPLVAALKQNPPARPDPSRATQIESASGDARAGVAVYRELRLAVEALLAEGRRSGRAPSDKSLATVIEEARQRHVLARQDAIQSAAKVERDAAAARLADAERAKVEAAARVQEEKQRAELAAAEREAQRVKASAEADRLRAKAKDPAIIKRYSQFLGEGTYAPAANITKEGRTGRRYQFPSHLSLSNLKNHDLHTNVLLFAAFGAKQYVSADGVAATRYRGTENDNYLDYDKNDRDGKWKWPQTREELAAVRTLQAEFFDLAPYWVEQGLLRK